MSPEAVHQMDLEMGTDGATCDESQKGNAFLSSKKMFLLGIGILSISGLWLFNDQSRRRLCRLCDLCKKGWRPCCRLFTPAEKNWFCTGNCLLGVGCEVGDRNDKEVRCGTCGLRGTVPCCESFDPCFANCFACGFLGCRWSWLLCRNEGCCNYCTPDNRNSADGTRCTCEGQCKTCKYPCGLTCFGTTFADALCWCPLYDDTCRDGKAAKLANYKENCFLFDVACMGFGASCGVIRCIWDCFDDILCWGTFCKDEIPDANSIDPKKRCHACCKPCTGKEYDSTQTWFKSLKKLRIREDGK